MPPKGSWGLDQMVGRLDQIQWDLILKTGWYDPGGGNDVRQRGSDQRLMIGCKIFFPIQKRCT